LLTSNLYLASLGDDDQQLAFSCVKSSRRRYCASRQFRRRSGGLRCSDSSLLLLDHSLLRSPGADSLPIIIGVVVVSSLCSPWSVLLSVLLFACDVTKHRHRHQRLHRIRCWSNKVATATLNSKYINFIRCTRLWIWSGNWAHLLLLLLLFW